MIEVQNVVDTVFGNSAAAIDKFAKSATDNFGLTELQAKKFSSTIGAVFGGMGISGGALTGMSTGIAGLAGDLASFYNLNIDDAFNKLKSGITGETEPLKQLGIVMNQANLEAFAMSKGMKTAWKSMDQAAQTTLRYQFILEKTALAQGDYAKPIDSWAVSSRNLSNAFEEMRGKLAAGLLPALIQAADFITGIVRRVSEWADANRELIATKAQQFIQGVVTWINRLLPLVKMGYKFIKEWYPVIIGAFVAFKSFSLITGVMGGVNAAMGILAGTTATAAGTAGTAATAFGGLTTAITASQFAMAGLIGLAIGGAIAVWGMAKKNQQRLANEAGVSSEGWGEAHNRALDAVEKWRMDSDLAMATGDYGEWIKNNPQVFYKEELQKHLDAVREREKNEKPDEDDPMAEMKKLMEESNELMKKQLEATLGLGDGGKGVPGRLRYAAMGVEDFFSIARAGL
jgi:hypothetical protein